jgi:hypothetical protein
VRLRTGIGQERYESYPGASGSIRAGATSRWGNPGEVRGGSIIVTVCDKKLFGHPLLPTQHDRDGMTTEELLKEAWEPGIWADCASRT